MMARFEGATLRVTSAPLTIVLDGLRWGPRQAEIANTVVREARRRHLETRLLFWSHDILLDAVPLDSYADEHSLGARGRFVTPLVEGGLLGTGALVCFVDGWVPDWDDWADEVKRRFGRRVSVLLGSQGHALTDTWAVSDSIGEIEPTERDVIARLFGARVTSISVRFDGCVPTSLPAGWVAKDEDGGLGVSWAGEEDSLTVDLAPVSRSSTCLVATRVCDSDGSIVTLEAEVPGARPEPPSWRRLDETESERVRLALASYRDGSSEHDCPSCGHRHRFEKAFHCSRGDFFSAASGLCQPRGVGFAPGDRIAIRPSGDSAAVAVVGLGSAAWLGDVAAVRGADCWIVADRDGVVVDHLGAVWPALFGNGAGDLWIVET